MKPFMSARDVAARAIAEHPERSSRKIAEVAGVSDVTIVSVRNSAFPTNGVDEKRLGRDGRHHSPRKKAH